VSQVGDLSSLGWADSWGVSPGSPTNLTNLPCPPGAFLRNYPYHNKRDYQNLREWKTIFSTKQKGIENVQIRMISRRSTQGPKPTVVLGHRPL